MWSKINMRHFHRACGLPLTRSSSCIPPPCTPYTKLVASFPSRRSFSHARPGAGQQPHTSAVRSEKCARLRGSAWARMRGLGVFFCPRVPDLLPWCMSVLSHDFKRLERFTKLATSSILCCLTPVCTSPCWYPKPPTAAARPEYGGRARRRWRRA